MEAAELYRVEVVNVTDLCSKFNISVQDLVTFK